MTKTLTHLKGTMTSEHRPVYVAAAKRPCVGCHCVHNGFVRDTADARIYVFVFWTHEAMRDYGTSGLCNHCQRSLTK